MIRPPGVDGVAFTEVGDGDQRLDLGSRAHVSDVLQLPDEWATAHQIHGDAIHRAQRPGEVGEGDGLWSTVHRLPLAVFTADCFGVVLHAPEAVGVAHVGWRGARAGLVTRLRAAMIESGHTPASAAIGPGIGPCCFEVGDEVGVDFGVFRARTSWAAPSVDLPAFIRSELTDLEIWSADRCTFHEPGWFSHRRDQTSLRLATIGWLP